MKKRRIRLTLAERLEPIDRAIKSREDDLAKLKAKRQDLITAEEAKARASMQAVEDAKSPTFEMQS